MFRFEYTQHLIWLAAVAPLMLAFILFMVWRNNAIKKLGNAKLLERLMPDSSMLRHPLKFVLAAFAFIMLVIAYANPQFGSKYEKVQRQGIELIIALDVSRSMNAEDVKPSRLDRSKQFVSRLIEKLPNDKVGLIVFAGNAWLQVPITIDHSATKLLLNNVSTEGVPTQGTNFEAAIHMAMRSFESNGDKKHRALLIISDGENHEEDALNAAADASNEGIVINTIGVGDPKGAPIPETKNGGQADFKRDENGNIVLTKLNEDILKQIAAKGNGEYLHMSSGTEELNELVKRLNGMEKKNMDEKVVTDFESQFQYFIIIALILLTLEFFISERKGNWVNWNKLFK